MVRIGELASSVDSLQRSMDNLRDDMSQERLASSNNRHHIHSKIDTMSDKINDVENDLKDIKTNSVKVNALVDNRVLPAVVTIENITKRGKVSMAAAATIGGGVSALIFANFNPIWEWLKRTF